MLLIEKLRSLQNANAEIIDQIAESFIPKTFNKGLLLSTPEYSHPVLYYVENGLARGYFLHEGKENTSWIIESGFILPSTSFFAKTSSAEHISFISDSIGYSMNLSLIDDFAKVDPTFYRILLEIYEEDIHLRIQRERMLRIRHAETRFLHSQKEYPELIYLPIHNIIASFLNIESKYFFKIKRKYR
ncbi:Crp/Fnr family transcriptional regulator [Pedobacter jamesrossensis]|uniref:Crp/Fnr family transcriptional regulator n=1 Tax=Pedobacter jamesrossensis TaxID=1908238 RepID=A0ABV8NRG8_9SPHI